MTYQATSWLENERKRNWRTRHAREKNKTDVESVAPAGAGRAREFRVNELICIENENSDDDGGYAPDDDRDDAPTTTVRRECETLPRRETRKQPSDKVESDVMTVDRFINLLEIVLRVKDGQLLLE